MILVPNCSDYVTTLIKVARKELKLKKRKGMFSVLFPKKGKDSTAYLDYENYSFKQLLGMARIFLYFTDKVEVEHKYIPLNEDEEMCVHMVVEYKKEAQYSVEVPVRIIVIELGEDFKESVFDFKDYGDYCYEGRSLENSNEVILDKRYSVEYEEFKKKREIEREEIRKEQGGNSNVIPKL